VTKPLPGPILRSIEIQTQPRIYKGWIFNQCLILHTSKERNRFSNMDFLPTYEEIETFKSVNQLAVFNFFGQNYGSGKFFLSPQSTNFVRKSNLFIDPLHLQSKQEHLLVHF